MGMLSLVHLTLWLVVAVGELSQHDVKKYEATDSNHSMQMVDNDPEFLVGVRGIDKPMCFRMEGVAEDVIRLLQDPVSGVVVNARIFQDPVTNKTYLGAIMVGRDDFRLIAKQHYVDANDHRLLWNRGSTLVERGHRIVVDDNMCAITFHQLKITFIIRRHFATREGNMDYGDPAQADDSENDHVDTDAASNGATVENNENNEDSDTITNEYNPTRADMAPTLTENAEDLPPRNGAESTKRRRSLFMPNFFKFPRDETITRNVIVDVGKINGNQNAESPEYNRVQGSRKSRRSVQEDESSVLRQKRNSRRQRLRDEIERRQRHRARNADRRGADTSETSGDRRRNRTIFLGVYLADSRDLSNQTHGLLGQFLFKNGTLERMRIKNGRVKARLVITGVTTSHTIGLITLRHNHALNTTRACWRIRNQGHDIIDGWYSDYLVPGLRNLDLKELPPRVPPL